MTLLRAVGKLEAARAGAYSAPGTVGLVWSRDEVLFTGRLEEGEFIARDMHVLELATDSLPAMTQMVERVTRDENDLGWVYDAAGAVLGRVVELEDSLIRWRHESAPAGLSVALVPVGLAPLPVAVAGAALLPHAAA
jgi:hypothetical protein